MIVGKDFEAWLADSRRQHQTQAAIDGYARRWRYGPVQARFEKILAGLPEQSAEAIGAAMQALFADDSWLETLIDGLVDALAQDPYFEPPFRPMTSDVHHGLLVFEDRRVSIAAGVSNVARLAAKKSGPRGATSIGFTGQLTILKFVQAGDALISLWEAPPITAGFSASEAGRCTRVGEQRLKDGDILVIDGRRQSYVIEAARRNLLVVQAAIASGQAPVSVEYDSTSGTFIGCSAIDDSASRIQMITTLLRKLDCDAGFAAAAAFLDHPDFFVRWHVMRELLGIDAAAALPLLRRMAEADPHPEPRRTARSVLDRLERAA
jgi:hypothetical protein